MLLTLGRGNTDLNLAAADRSVGDPLCERPRILFDGAKYLDIIAGDAEFVNVIGESHTST